MSYTKRPDLKVSGDRAMFELEDGTLVALHIETTRDPVTNRASYRAHAAAFNADLTPMLDAHGNPIEAECTFSPAPEVLAAKGDDGIGRELALLVLGEPASEDPDATAWSDDFRTSASIRHALAMADMTGPFDNLHSIL